MHRCFDAKKLLSSDEAGDSSFNFGRNIEFKKMIISMQKKKTRALCTVFFLSYVALARGALSSFFSKK